MKTRNYLLAMLLASVIGLTACGGTSEAEVPDTPVLDTEETDAAEAEKLEAEAVDAEEAAPETEEKVSRGASDGLASSGEDYKAGYLDVVESFYNDYSDDPEVRFNLVSIDEDDIPELLLFASDDAWYGIDMFTFVDGDYEYVMRDDENGEAITDTTFTSPGRQSMGDEYIENENIYLMTGGEMGSIWTVGYQLDGTEFKEIFRYEYLDGSWADEKNPEFSYALSYKDKSGKDVKVSKDVKESDDIYFIDSIPEAKDLEKEFGFSFSNKKDMNEDTLTYEEIIEKLS